MDEKLWLSLSRVRGLGIKKLLEINRASISNNDVSIDKFRKILGEAIYNKVNNSSYIESLMDEVEEIYRTHAERQIDIISYVNNHYPESLRNIEEPPITLYCKGNLDALKALKKVAIIGNRAATTLGVEAAKKLAAKFAEMGYVIVSGLAEGIDTGGHIGALEAKGITIAVLPSNLEDILPKSNRELAERIVENKGLLISEYPLGQDFLKKNFIEYCRIQSGLSLGVCFVQADVTGGTMHTVGFAESQGKVVFCPQILEDENLPQYRGVVKLLSEKRAVLLSGSQDYSFIDSLLMKGN